MGDRTSTSTGRPGSIPFVDLYLPYGPASAVPIPLLDAKFSAADISIEAGPSTYAVSGQRLFLMSMVHTMKNTAAGGNILTLTILDPSWDYLTTLLAQNHTVADQQFRVAYGWRDVQQSSQGGLSLSQSREVVFFVNDIEMDLVPFRGAVVTIHGVDKISSLMSAQMSRAFLPTDTISSVIRQIITDLGLYPVVSEIPLPVGDMCRMENITPQAYIEELMRVARSATGASNYIMSTRSLPTGETAVYVQPAFPAKPNSAVATYVFGRDRTGEMLSFTPRMNSKLLTLFGGGRCTSVAVDLMSKRLVRLTTTQAEDIVTHPMRSIATPEQPSLIVESPYDPATALAQAAAYRQTADAMQYSAAATVVGNTSLVPTEYVNVVVLKGGASYEQVRSLSVNDIHLFSSGVWQMWEVTHQIDASSGFHTQLELRRMSGFVGAGTAGISVPVDFDTRAGPAASLDSDLVEVTPIDNPGEDASSALSAVKTFLGFLGG
jgi:hypothetical protein